MIGKYQKQLYFTNGDAPWQKRNWTKGLSPCTSFCVLDCLLKASGAKTQAQPLYRQARAQGASRRPSSRRGSHQPVPCLTRVGESGLSDSSLCGAGWERWAMPPHTAATHPDSSRITKKLRRVEKMNMWKVITAKIESDKQVPTPHTCHLHFHFLYLHSTGPHFCHFLATSSDVNLTFCIPCNFYLSQILMNKSKNESRFPAFLWAGI